ncbi:sugar transferase [Novosphingobium sp. HII-3]|uniref:sugar transferase n=1 Tax=Novosphingobium sp. HII-3 TaxID=2075565 RepID=UPI001304B1E9|nr:sugar transferase [Novosphingobium sp. HII-3]
MKGITKYPGVEQTSYIAPAFFASYGLLLIIYVLGRLEYSRILITSSFLINVLLFYCLNSTFLRRRKMHIGIVPEGEYLALSKVKGVEWTILQSHDANVAHLNAISVDLRSDVSNEWERRLANFALEGLPVYHSKHLLESLTGKVAIEHLSENSFGTLSPLYAYMRIKRVVDFIAAVLALIALFPALLVIGIMIAVDSRGPILFRQVRIGYQGRPFRVFKFRTMVAEPKNEPVTTIEAAKTKDSDKRITRIGGFLRQSRLDELPQILNVIKGEMSWIGPRPEAEVLSRWYENEIPFYRYRHIVYPGITGWAQVNQGHVSEVNEVTSKLHYDFYYIKNFSPWIDVLIVMRTIRTMLTGFGAR